MHNVIVDLRAESPTYLETFALELSAENRLSLYVPRLFATAMQTLADDTEAYYQVSDFYAPEAERGLRFDDPALGVTWPLPVSEISDKDLAWPAIERGLK
jgi:dTDP-4-dehydrorhamnose 3,5-epimerase